MNIRLLFVKVMNRSGIIAWLYKSFPSLLTRNSILLSLHSDFLHLSFAILTLYLYKFPLFLIILNLSLHLHVMRYTLHSLFILLWCEVLLYFVVVSPVNSVWNRRTLWTCHFCKTAVFVRAHNARVPAAKSVHCIATWRTLCFL